MGSILFTVIISPIIQVLEFFYVFFFQITSSQGASVIGLSFVVTLLTLPLYMVAESWQEKERLIQKKMEPTVARIKEVFKGDERYMITTTYYRQNHYHPLMALRSSFSLLIQIPFFISAYQFLSHLDALKGHGFLFIRDFGSPDSTFVINGFAINVLPLAMTIINCISGILYSKGHPLSEKIQIFACAAVFLVLLYSSPAGLVVYWTMNNILSLTKNIFYKLKNPLKVIYCLLCLLSISLILCSIFVFKSAEIEFRIIVFAIAVFIPLIPFAIKTWNELIDYIFTSDAKINFASFFVPALIFFLLSGLVIPSTLMESEPEQYCFVENNTSPFVFLRHTMFQAVGFCLFWPTCFFSLFSNKVKKSLVLLYTAGAILALINCFIFSENYGPILPELIFMTPQKFKPSVLSLALNAFTMIAGIILSIAMLKHKEKLTKTLLSLIVFSLAIVTVKNVVSINSEFRRMTPPSSKTEIEKSYHFSKTGKNVLVIMQDRFFLPYITQILAEFPEFSEQMDGFTFYNNTCSMGPLTMIGTPGIFGGYDYTPWEIVSRKDETLQKKHNEALLTMPRLFNKAGFSVTVSGLPYENYLEYPITDMYKDDQYVVRAETRGAYSDYWYKENNFPKFEYLEHDIKRNFIWFSLFKIVPPVARRFVYHENYWTSFNYYNDGVARFIDNYSELEYLPEMFDAESDKDSFILIDNETVHESIVLPADTFNPADLNKENCFIDPTKNDHYTTMVAVFKKYDGMIKRLKDLGVYDNTRIIIVSDHGAGFITPDLENNIPGLLKQTVVASLLVKDFNSHGVLKTDSTFMTNADTPYLATSGILKPEEQINPFTNKPLKKENKNDYVKIDLARSQSTRNRYKSGWDIPENAWFTVHDNIYRNENWSPLFSK